MRETWIQSLGWEDSLEKGKATQPSILAWRILWTEEWEECKFSIRACQLVKNPPSVQETLVQFLGREDLLKG